MGRPLHCHDLHTLAQQAGLSAQFPDGHVALCLALRQLGVDCHLHRYTVTLGNAHTQDTSYGFAIELDGQVWAIGNLLGWDAIEQAERKWGAAMFEEWAGGPPTRSEFSSTPVETSPYEASAYVNSKTTALSHLLPQA